MNTIVLHGKTRWSETLSDYSFRDGVTHTVTFASKGAITHREGSRCLNRTTAAPPVPETIEATRKEFDKQVKLEADGKDRTAWFCTRCLIHLDPAKKADEQLAKAESKPEPVAAAKPVAPKTAGSKITRPKRSSRTKASARA